MMPMLPVILILAAVVGIGWAIYYFQFSERAVERLVQRVMRESGSKRRLQSDYRAVVTDEGIACEHPKRPREFILWSDVAEISVVRTSDGPLLPDFWVLIAGTGGGCSIPTEAEGFDSVFKAFECFRGIDYGGFLKGGQHDTRHVLWSRDKASA